MFENMFCLSRIKFFKSYESSSLWLSQQWDFFRVLFIFYYQRPVQNTVMCLKLWNKRLLFFWSKCRHYLFFKTWVPFHFINILMKNILYFDFWCQFLVLHFFPFHLFASLHNFLWNFVEFYSFSFFQQYFFFFSFFRTSF